MTNLNKEQARAINHINGPCLVLAGPGSGKTFTLVNRIINMTKHGISPSSLLVITFSKKAAIEMKYRYEKYVIEDGGGSNNVYFGTFHAVFYNILKQQLNFNKDSVLTDNEKLKLIDIVFINIFNNLNKDMKSKYALRFKSKEYKKTILKAISLHKIEKTTLNILNNPEFSSIFENEEDETVFLKVSSNYQKLCKDNKKLDFEDMLYMCRDILKNNSLVLDKYRSIYKYFLVDEFQDINEIQYEVLMLLAGDDKNIFAVGDDDQSIYGFRGSKPEFMKRFIEENEGVKVIDMFNNYRSAEYIIDCARKLIINNKSRIAKRQVAASNFKENGNVYITTVRNANEEADFVINKLTSDNESNSVAIIFRTNKCVNILKERLRFSGIKCISSSKQIGFYETEWVKDIISYLKIAYCDNKELIYRILNRPDRGLTRDSNTNALIGQINVIKNMSPYAAVMYVLKAIGYEKYYFEMQQQYGVEKIESISALNEILEIAREYNSIRDWLDAIDVHKEDSQGTENICENNNNEDGKRVKQVHLLTAHASKGLEFDTVFVVGLQEGIFPHRKAISEEQLEEERRLLYVAITRAKRTLFVVGRGEEKYGKRVSMFIGEIGGIMPNNEV